ncbi:helix-turn-helix domain-containing protein [Alicyclobacillus fodiniaquatilis]|uniref:Helix-turn-helix domain-containing protein n=1 Tax=Alicyclobacillus fodiniaquatilis TaxID=1661150 RepID=A0ABW4JI31_9BACL
MASHSQFAVSDWPPLFDCKKLAEILGVSVSAAREIMRREDFRVTIISPRRHRIRREDLQAWLEKQSG